MGINLIFKSKKSEYPLPDFFYQKAHPPSVRFFRHVHFCGHVVFSGHFVDSHKIVDMSTLLDIFQLQYYKM